MSTQITVFAFYTTINKCSHGAGKVAVLVIGENQLKLPPAPQ